METLDTLDETSGVQAVVAAVRNRANEIRGNLGPKNLWEERVERADELTEIADRTEKAYRLENHCPKRFDKDGDEMPPHCAFDDLKIDRLAGRNSELKAEVEHLRDAAKMVGNSAKLREVLKRILDEWGCDRTLRDAAEAALSAPARNCDLPQCRTPEGVAEAWNKHCTAFKDGDESCDGCIHQHSEHKLPCIAEWLLAEAPRKEGAEHGNGGAA